jgi:hypothetical protein
LIKHLKAFTSKACGGERTPYPQKRQQCLGVILTILWKTLWTACKAGFSRGFIDKNGQSIIL